MIPVLQIKPIRAFLGIAVLTKPIVSVISAPNQRRAVRPFHPRAAQ
jgi:hypothetical protein